MSQTTHYLVTKRSGHETCCLSVLRSILVIATDIVYVLNILVILSKRID